MRYALRENMGRILALDIGEKRTGLAITDETKTISQPLPYTAGPDELFDTLSALFSDYEVEKIIVGLPKSLSGEDSAQTKEVRRVGEEIKQAFEKEIIYVDERLTTKRAEFLARDNRGVPVDSLAAQLLLEDYLKMRNA